MKRFLLFFIIILFFLAFIYFKNNNFYDFLNNTEEQSIGIDKYFVYGSHLNIFGSYDLPFDSSNTKLVLKSVDDEIEFDLNFDDGCFNISNYINDGINLDSIPIGFYFVFFKYTDGDQVKYYNLHNNTSYGDINYITTTLNNSNNSVNISFSDYNKRSYMAIDVSHTTVSDSYYDVVIDPGHGGDDPGASYSNYSEASLNLKCALLLKKKFDELGIRSILTRDDDVTIYNYGNKSRTSLPYEVGAKYYISIHLNSTDGVMDYGGVEVYAPNNSDLGFASNIAKSIVTSARTSYSMNESFNVMKGVYVRTFTQNEINESISYAKNNNYIPYPITTDTNYYFMIREVGGFMTGAYMDGRDKSILKNPYYNSNIGVESYLLELGYINFKGDLDNLIYNMDGYVEGIVSAYSEKMGIKK